MKNLINKTILNSSLIDILTKEDDSKKKNNVKSVKAEERSKHLYFNAVQKIENKKYLIKEKEEMNKSRELEKCTFKPKINKNYKNIKNISIDYKISQKKKET